MQATITYLLSEQAQRVQMAATGQPVARKQTITVEVPTADLALMQLTEDGLPYLDLCPAANSRDAAQDMNPSVPHCKALLEAGAMAGVQWYKAGTGLYKLEIPLIPDANADILALIRAGNAKLRIAQEAENAQKEAKQAGIDAKIREFLQSAAPITDRYSTFHVGYADISGRDDDLAKSYRVEAERRFASHEAEEKLKRALYERKEAEYKERKDAEQAALEALKTDAIAAFIAASGDELLQQQQAEGLLCRKTVISLMADAALTAAGVPAECPDSVVCENRECKCGDVVVDCIPRAAYGRWKGLGLPDTVAVEFDKVRNCLRSAHDFYPEDGRQTAGPVEYHAHITLQSGPFQFTRRIKV